MVKIVQVCGFLTEFFQLAFTHRRLSFPDIGSAGPLWLFSVTACGNYFLGLEHLNEFLLSSAVMRWSAWKCLVESPTWTRYHQPPYTFATNLLCYTVCMFICRCTICIVVLTMLFTVKKNVSIRSMHALNVSLSGRTHLLNQYTKPSLLKEFFHLVQNLFSEGVARVVAI